METEMQLSRAELSRDPFRCAELLAKDSRGLSLATNAREVPITGSWSPCLTCTDPGEDFPFEFPEPSPATPPSQVAR
jgi:hypothetical protein